MRGENLSELEIIFCHGLMGSPDGRKATALREAGFNVRAPDFRGLDLEERVEVLLNTLREIEGDFVLIGSSYGALVSLFALGKLEAEVTKKPEELLLLAPAINFPEADSVLERSPAPTTIIHGRNDQLIPIELVRGVARSWGATLIEVEDFHPLANSLERIVFEVKRIIERYRFTGGNLRGE